MNCSVSSGNSMEVLYPSPGPCPAQQPGLGGNGGGIVTPGVPAGRGVAYTPTESVITDANGVSRAC